MITTPKSPTDKPEAKRSPDVEPLALRAKDAAPALGIGKRKLWELTNRGEIPHLKIGKAILYPVAELRTWLAKQTKGVRK